MSDPSLHFCSMNDPFCNLVPQELQVKHYKLNYVDSMSRLVCDFSEVSFYDFAQYVCTFYIY